MSSSRRTRLPSSRSICFSFSRLLLVLEALDATLGVRPTREPGYSLSLLLPFPPTLILTPLDWIVIRWPLSAGMPTAIPLIRIVMSDVLWPVLAPEEPLDELLRDF